MNRIKSYVTHPEALNDNFLDFNVALSSALDSNLHLIVHSKEIFEPTISPIIGSGLPVLNTDETNKLRASLEDYLRKKKNVDYRLSQDIFAEIFSEEHFVDDVNLYTFSIQGADFVLHNVYSDSALDQAFNYISPALFVPDNYAFTSPKNLNVLLFSENLGSDLSYIQELASILGSKINFIIQEPNKDEVSESILAKITKANNIDLKGHKFSARFVEKINYDLLESLSEHKSEASWTVFQHSFLIQDHSDKKLDIDLYQLISDSKHPMIIV